VGVERVARLVAGDVERDDERPPEALHELDRLQAAGCVEVAQRAQDQAGLDAARRRRPLDSRVHDLDRLRRREVAVGVQVGGEAGLGVDDVVACELVEEVVDDQLEAAAVLHAQSLENSGQYENALVEFEKAIATNPRMTVAYLGAGDIYRQKGDYKKAAEALSEGRIEEGFEELQKLGWIKEVPDAERYRELVDDLRTTDWFMVTADFDAYADTQSDVAMRWCDRHAWWRSSVLNTARMGWFSSDRTIREYAEEIWGVPVIRTSG